MFYARYILFGIYLISGFYVSHSQSENQNQNFDILNLKFGQKKQLLRLNLSFLANFGQRLRNFELNSGFN